MVKDYRKGSYTVHDIKLHFVIILKGVVSKDHIHVLVSCPPTMAPCKLAQVMKGKSSFKIQQEFPELKKRYWGQHI